MDRSRRRLFAALGATALAAAATTAEAKPELAFAEMELAEAERLADWTKEGLVTEAEWRQWVEGFPKSVDLYEEWGPGYHRYSDGEADTEPLTEWATPALLIPDGPVEVDLTPSPYFGYVEAVGNGSSVVTKTPPSQIIRARYSRMKWEPTDQGNLMWHSEISEDGETWHRRPNAVSLVL